MSEEEISNKIEEVNNKAVDKEILKANDPKTETEDWSEEYKGDRPTGDSNWFSDMVPKGEISYQTEYEFKTEGEKKTNNFGKQVIAFTINHENKEKTMEVGCNQYDFLKVLAENKPLTGKTFVHQRTGEGQKATRRSVKLKQE